MTPTTPEELARDIQRQIDEWISGPPDARTFQSIAAALIAEAFERWSDEKNDSPHGWRGWRNAARRLAKWRNLALAKADFYYHAGRAETARAEKAEARVRELEASCDGCAYDDSEECTDCRRRRRTDYYRAIEEARE